MVLALLLVMLGCACVLACITTACWMCITGVRGRMLDSHPYCKSCGFDLIGHCPRPDTCIECGATLRAVGAVRVGRRTYMPQRIVIGLMLLGICVLPLIGYAASRQSQGLPVPVAFPAQVQAARPSATNGSGVRAAWPTANASKADQNETHLGGSAQDGLVTMVSAV
jgi:hypothetical protein